MVIDRELNRIYNNGWNYSWRLTKAGESRVLVKLLSSWPQSLISFLPENWDLQFKYWLTLSTEMVIDRELNRIYNNGWNYSWRLTKAGESRVLVKSLSSWPQSLISFLPENWDLQFKCWLTLSTEMVIDRELNRIYNKRWNYSWRLTKAGQSRVLIKLLSSWP